MSWAGVVLLRPGKAAEEASAGLAIRLGREARSRESAVVAPATSLVMRRGLGDVGTLAARTGRRVRRPRPGPELKKEPMWFRALALGAGAWMGEMDLVYRQKAKERELGASPRRAVGPKSTGWQARPRLACRAAAVAFPSHRSRQGLGGISRLTPVLHLRDPMYGGQLHMYLHEVGMHLRDRQPRPFQIVGIDSWLEWTLDAETEANQSLFFLPSILQQVSYIRLYQNKKKGSKYLPPTSSPQVFDEAPSIHLWASLRLCIHPNVHPDTQL